MRLFNVMVEKEMKRGSLVLREIFRGYRILLVFNWEQFQGDSKESMKSRSASLRKDNYVDVYVKRRLVREV